MSAGSFIDGATNFDRLDLVDSWAPKPGSSVALVPAPSLMTGSTGKQPTFSYDIGLVGGVAM